MAASASVLLQVGSAGQVADVKVPGPTSTQITSTTTPAPTAAPTAVVVKAHTNTVKTANASALSEADFKKLQTLVSKTNEFKVATDKDRELLSTAEFFTNISFFTLKIPSKDFKTKEGQIIKRLRLINRRESGCDATEAALIEVATEQGQKFLLKVPDKEIRAVEDLLRDLKAARENCFRDCEYRSFLNSNWLKKPAIVTYQYSSKPKFDMVQYYQELHEKFAGVVCDTLAEHKVQQVKLFAFGCGDGDDIRTAVAMLNARKMIAAGIGFDINDSNFEVDDASASVDVPCILKEGDTLKLYQLHQQYKTSSVFRNLDEKQTKTTMMFCGSMTRHVLDGSKEGLLVLQQACRSSDFAFFGGKEAVLFTRRMAKECGWLCDIVRIKLEQKQRPDLFLLKKPTEQERQEWLVKQFIKNKDVLDLSKSCDPAYDLRLLVAAEVDFKGIKRVDLSWVFVSEDDVPGLVKALSIFSNRKPLVTLQYDTTNKHLYAALMQLKNVTLVENDRLAPFGNPKFPELSPFSKRFIERHNIKPMQPPKPNTCSVM